MVERRTLWIGVSMLLLVAFGIVWRVKGGSVPIVAMSGLGISLIPLVRAWSASQGLAIRPAIVWSFIAVVLGMIAQLAALREALETGRPDAGHWAYLSSLATLAALISVLGARSPGGGAWAILMGLLIVVFLIPWLESSGIRGRGNGLARLRLEAPWSIFFVLLTIAGVTNYLPTRFGAGALLIGASLIAEFLALVNPSWLAARRGAVWSLSPLLASVGVCVAGIPSRPPATSEVGLPAVWRWFRNTWGVVWALRVQERFNRAAASSKWPFRLTWAGVEPSEGVPGVSNEELPPAALKTFEGLIRRFASPEQIADASRLEHPDSCLPSVES